MERKISILIVEDELIVADYIQDCLEKLHYEIAGIAMTYQQAVDMLSVSLPDLILMDISLKGAKNGIELGEYVTRQYGLPFIFTTSHSDRVTIDRAKQVMPYAYLIKPFSEEDLYAAIETAITQYARTKTADEEQQGGQPPVIIDNAIFLRNKDRFVKLKLEELLYIEANDNYCTLFAQGNSYVLKTPLKTLQDNLPEYFWRIHRSFVINLHHLKSFKTDEVQIGERTLPVGKSYYPLFVKKLNILQG